MPIIGQRLAPIFDASLTRATAQRMAARGTRQLHARVVEFTPVAPPPDPVELQSAKRAALRARRPPGTLKRSWRETPVVETRPGVYEGGTETDDPIAQFVEEDTRPHLIEQSRPGLPLAWVKDGEWHRATHVHHPGTRGAHMAAKGALVVEAEVEAGLLDFEADRMAAEFDALAARNPVVVY